MWIVARTPSRFTTLLRHCINWINRCEVSVKSYNACCPSTQSFATSEQFASSYSLVYIGHFLRPVAWSVKKRTLDQFLRVRRIRCFVFTILAGTVNEDRNKINNVYREIGAQSSIRAVVRASSYSIRFSLNGPASIDIASGWFLSFATALPPISA